jgi:hypothetical protein
MHVVHFPFIHASEQGNAGQAVLTADQHEPGALLSFFYPAHWENVFLQYISILERISPVQILPL